MTRRTIEPPTLAPEALDIDRILVGKPEKLWGRKTIAAELGLPEDAVTTLAERDDTPIFRPGGRYFALRSELRKWLRTKPAKRRKKAEKAV